MDPGMKCPSTLTPWTPTRPYTPVSSSPTYQGPGGLRRSRGGQEEVEEEMEEVKRRWRRSRGGGGGGDGEGGEGT